MKTRVSAILLAAGESRRMGGRNKLLLPVGGVALIRRSALTLLASSVHEVVAVLGHEARRMRPLIEDLPLAVIENPHYREGQMTSVHAGLAALTEARGGVLVCLADQPLLTPADIDRLVDTFGGQDTAVLVPTYQGRRGNPIILSWAQREPILSGHRNLGCKRFIESHPDLVSTLEMPTDHVVVDLDTPDDYEALLARLEAPAAITPERVGAASAARGAKGSHRA